MPEQKQELKYYDKLNIQIVSIDRVKELIKRNIRNTLNCWEKGINVQKITFHVIGPAGVGKTEICKQIVSELSSERGEKWDLILIKAPVITRDDFLIPFPVVTGNKEEAVRFKMLYSDFVPRDENSCGLFVIDEFGRGDHNLQQLLWQVQNEYKLHLRELPRKWFVISIDNPDDQEYSLDLLEDAAGLRRMLHIYVEVSVPAFLRYARQNNFHPYVIDFIESHNEHLYDFQAQRRGSVYANPASWEKVSDLLWGYEKNNLKIKDPDVLCEIEILVSGLVNMSVSRLFADHIKEQQDTISVSDIIKNYSKVKKTVEKFVNEKENTKLGHLVTSFANYLISSKPDLTSKELQNISSFMLDIPLESTAVLITLFDTLDKNSEEFRYVTNLHFKLVNSSKEYRKRFFNQLTTKAEDAKNFLTNDRGF